MCDFACMYLSWILNEEKDKEPLGMAKNQCINIEREREREWERIKSQNFSGWG